MILLMYMALEDFRVGVCSRPRKMEYNMEIINMFAAPEILDSVYQLSQSGVDLSVC